MSQSKTSKDFVEGTEQYKSYANEVTSRNNQVGFQKINSSDWHMIDTQTALKK